MVIAVILVTYFINHVLDKKYPWIWPSLLCASGFGICCSTYLFLDMPIIDTWIFLFPLFYSVFFFSNSLKAAIPWTRRRSAGAASASSPPSPEEGRESACRTSTTSQAAPRERAASPSRKGPSLRGSRFPTAKRRDKSNTRRRRCATDRDMAHGVFHSKGDRPRGGTGGLRIRLCHHDLHDRKHPGAPARPVPRRSPSFTPVSPPAGGTTPPRTCAAS